MQFDSSAPVFITAPQEISLYHGKKRDAYESGQMDRRVKYMRLSYMIPEQNLKETNPCAHCGARLYLEGSEGFASMATQVETSSASSSSGAKRSASQAEVNSGFEEHPSSKASVSDSVLGRLHEVHALKQSGILDTPESKRLKDQILADLSS